MTETIDIALACDERYSPGLCVTVGSLARHASRDVELRFTVLDGGISDDTWNRFCTAIGLVHPHCVFRRLKIDEGVFRAFPEWNFGSRMTYARFLLPELLPDTDHIVYCDVDFLWRADIAELWSLRRDDAIFCGVRELTESVLDREQEWFVNHALSFDRNRYCCAGLALYNLSVFREMGIAKLSLEFLNRHPDAGFVDQTALNGVLLGPCVRDGIVNITILPDRWQRLSRFVTDTDLSDGCVIHYAGDNPWTREHWYEPLSDVVLMWFREYAALHGISLFSALRRFYPVSRIVFLRGVALALELPGIRHACYFYLEKIRKSVVVRDLKEKNRRLRWT